jgi:hypothetical protein
MWDIQKIVYYLAIKRKEALTLATVWMNFESILLSGRS